MRLTAYSLVLFFICLNISVYLINQSQILATEQPPYESPEDIRTVLLHVDLSGENLLIGVIPLAANLIIGYITGHFIYGGTVALILFGLNLLFPVVKWVLFGFPVFLQQIGAPIFIVTGVNTLMAIVWVWFILGLIAQRQLER